MPRLTRILAFLTALAAGSQAAGAPDRGQEPGPSAPAPKPSFVRIDPSFFATASATGGDFYFWEPGEFAAHAPIEIPPDGEPVLLAYGELEPGGHIELRAPLDSTIGRLSLFAGLQGNDGIEVVLPGGERLMPNGTAVRVQQTRHMLIATIEDPSEGEIAIRLAGRGHYAVSLRAGRFPSSAAEAPDLIELDDFTWVAPGGRPGHEGLFPLEQDPAPRSKTMYRVKVSGSRRSTEVSLIDGSGRELARLQTDPAPGTDEPDAQREGNQDPDEERYGTATVPSVPFRVRARGLDQLGHPYQRLSSGLHGQ